MSSSSPPRVLFDDDDDAVEEKVDESSLCVNRRYATDYQQRKQLQEWRNYDQNDDDDSSSSSSSSEDEDGDLLDPSIDVAIVKTIHALRTRDASIYNPDTKFFPEPNATNDDEDYEITKEKKRTPKRVKDVIREQIVEQMNQEEAMTEDQDADVKAHAKSTVAASTTKTQLAYNQEQAALRKAFLESTQDTNDDADTEDDDDGGADNWMVLKKRHKVDQDADEKTNALLDKELEALEKTSTQTELKDPRGEVEDGDKFLLDFIKNKKWIDKDLHNDDDDSSEGKQKGSDDDSIDELEKADDFESRFNFRFEQADAETGKSGADFSNVGYARSGMMNTLRRKDDTRKHKRLERKERKAAERRAKEEQLRRLKNAKRQAMETKLQKVKSVLGFVETKGFSKAAVDEATLMKLIEGDYDPDKFEQIMNEAYGDDFYQQPETQWKTDGDVRESLLGDEDGNMIVGQDSVEGGLYDNEEEYGEEDDCDEEDEGDADWNEDDGDGHGNDNVGYEENETEQKLRGKMMDELYKLDYEDIVAGMPTRFKYRQVEKNDYGLSTEEILFARDSTLKNFVSLKKMAPYRDNGEYKVGSNKRRHFRELLQQDIEEVAKEKTHQVGGEVDETGAVDAESGKKKKTRRRQKKSKKKEQGEYSKEDATENASNEAEKPADEDANAKDAPPVEPLSKKKRKRKRKDKIDVPTQSESLTEDDNGDKGKGETKIKEKKIDPDKKRRKKKSLSVAGVSATRLASYNL